MARTRSMGESPSGRGGPQARPSSGPSSPRASGGRLSPASSRSFRDEAASPSQPGGGGAGPAVRPPGSPRLPAPPGPPGPPRNSNSPTSPRPRLSKEGGGSGANNQSFKAATPEEARTEVGSMLRECRLDEFTHKLVSEERFALLSDLRSLSPGEFDDLAIKVGLKLGQSRKLKKRLG
jgi:hypothetical protein